MKQVFCGQVVTPHKIIGSSQVGEQTGVVIIDDDRIEFVGTVADARESGYQINDDSLVGAENRIIMPGLVDVHSHGGGGASIPNATTPEIAMQAIMEHRRAGTTSYIGSLVTASPEVLLERTKMLADLCEAGELAGIHAEGPFVSVAKCGAQDPQFITEGKPELTKQLCDIAKGHLKWMTLAPEVPGNFPTQDGENSVAQVLIDNGVLPSWGHTDSTLPQMEAALEWSYDYIQNHSKLNSRPMVTHLFNGMPPLHHRAPGPVVPCLNAAREGRALVEIVGDGIHVNADLIREIYQMVGRENIALITDAMEAAGMPDGEYQLGSMKVIVKDRVARLAEGTSIAGGTARLIDVLRVVVKAGIPLVDAVYMASTTGAKALSSTDIGEIATGKRADLLIVQGAEEMAIEKVIFRGEEVA